MKAYCCSCRHGLRTVGCCGHVMSLIWYTLHIDHNKLNFPSVNLDHVFTNWQHFGVDPEILSEGDSELESNEDTDEESEGDTEQGSESESRNSSEDFEFESGSDSE